MINNRLTIIEQMTTIPSVGKMEVSFAKVQPATDSRLDVTDYHIGGRFRTDRPVKLFHKGNPKLPYV